MLKKEILKAIVDADSSVKELADYMGISTTTLYKFLNGKIKDYRAYVKPLHSFFYEKGVKVSFMSELWATTGVIYIEHLTENQLNSLGIESYDL